MNYDTPVAAYVLLVAAAILLALVTAGAIFGG
jgi:hypothetical protein